MSFERDSAEAVCIASTYDTPVSQKENEWSLCNLTEWRSMIALTFGLLINDLTRKLTSSIGQAVRMRKPRFFSVRSFSVQSSGMVKRGQDYANLPVLVAGRTYEFTGSCIASTKFTQSLSLKFKADGRAVNLVFRKSGFTLSAGK